MVKALRSSCVLLILAGATLLARGGEPATFRIPYMATPPTINGRIDPDEWRSAAHITGVVSGRGLIIPHQTVFYLSWDDDHLYLAGRSYLRPGINLVAPSTRGFGDSLEIGVFVMGRDRTKPDEEPRGYKFFLGTNGHHTCETFYPKSMANGTDAWTPQFTSANRLAPDPQQTFGAGTRIWDIELRANRSDFNLRQPNKAGDEWRFLLCHNTATPFAQFPMPVKLGFFNPEGYLSAVLTKDAPFAQLDNLFDVLRGKGALSVQVINPGAQPVSVTTAVSIARDKGAVLIDDRKPLTLPARGSATYTLQQPLPEDMLDGTSQLRITVTGAEATPIFSYTAPYQCSKELIQAAAGLLPGARQQLAPEIQWMVYSQYPSGMYVVNPEGMEHRWSYLSGAQCAPRISPSGKELLVTSSRGGTQGLWIFNLLTKDQRRICDGDQGCWSPHGDAILLRRNGRILLHTLATGAERPLTPAGKVWQQCMYPDYAPTGERILFVSDNRHLYMLPAAGGIPVRLMSGEILSAPRWSPDGKLIAVQDGAHLALIDPHGTRSALPADGGIQAQPIWSTDGHGIAYCQAPSARGPWQLRGIDRRHCAPSMLLKDRIDPGADLRWTCPAITDAPLAAPFALTTTPSGAAVLTHAPAPPVQVTGLDAAAIAQAQVGDHHVVLTGMQDRPLQLAGNIEALVVPDRLGDDLVIDPANVAAHSRLSFTPLVFGMLKGQQGIVVVYAPGARMSVAGREDGLALTLTPSASPVRIGVVAQEAHAWARTMEDDLGAFPALWRLTMRTSMHARSQMVAGVGHDLGQAVKTAQQREQDSVPAMLYAFGRTADTPAHLLTISDILLATEGVRGGASALQDDAALRFRVAERPTGFPTMALTVESIRHAIWSKMQDRYPQDVAGWCDDTLALVAAQDARLEAYGKFSASVNRTLFATRQAEQLSALLAKRDGFVKTGDLAALQAAVKAKQTDKLEAFATRTLAAGAEREQLLREARQVVRAMRNDFARHSSMGITAADGWYRKAGDLLSDRLYSEGDWRGEPVRMPFGRDWWGPVLEYLGEV